MPLNTHQKKKKYVTFSRCNLMLMASTKVVIMPYWSQCKRTPIYRDIHIHVCT